MPTMITWWYVRSQVQSKRTVSRGLALFMGALGGARQKMPATPGGHLDAGYIAAQIQAHEAAIALFKSQISSGRDNELPEFAMSTLPTLEAHLSMVQSLKQR